MEPFTLILVRHGQTLWNLEGRLQGHGDSPLSDTGIAQARAAAERLASIPIDALYASDLGRAMETARIVSETTGRPLLPEPRIRERGLGPLEGLTAGDAAREHPLVFRRYMSWDPDYAIPGGESEREVFERVGAWADRAAARHGGGAAAAITHGGVLNVFLRRVLGVPLHVPRRFRIQNAALHFFVYEDGAWLLERWGDTNHLPPPLLFDDQKTVRH
ncbi:MAG: histidine phosphatase family protein [Candidatus Eisenbacteria bacterium]|nr:histidine phosphatase family protein [Candidatus Eisenbacteria bacterium]